MALNIFLLAVGMALLVKGADWFVGGSSAIAKALKIPSLVIGLTLVSIGTSAPEASVSINSVVHGMKDLSIGNVVGSNIFNTLFILGVSAAIIPLSIQSAVKKYDIPIMVALYVVLIVFAFAITPLRLDIFESVTFLLLFAIYTAFLIVRAKRENKVAAANAVGTGVVPCDTDTGNVDGGNNTDLTAELADKEHAQSDADTAQSTVTTEKTKKEKPLWLSILLAVVGLAGIIYGGDLVVDKAAAIAKSLGMSESLVGLTIVAVGTSLPELVTSIVASVKKENDIAIGNVIGSNIFNIIFILGLSSCVSTLTVAQAALTDLLVMLGSGLIILALVLLSKKINRWQGAALILLYIAYLTYIIIRN